MIKIANSFGFSMCCFLNELFIELFFFLPINPLFLFETSVLCFLLLQFINYSGLGEFDSAFILASSFFFQLKLGNFKYQKWASQTRKLMFR